MSETVDLAVIVGVYAVLMGAGYGYLTDEARPLSYGVGAVSAALTSLFVAGLAPDAIVAAPASVLAFALTAYVRQAFVRAAHKRPHAAAKKTRSGETG